MREHDLIATTIDQYENYVNPAIAKLFRFMGLATIENHAKGMYIFDAHNKGYLDCLGGYGVFNLGHCNEEVIEAVKEQLDFMPLSGKIFLNAQLAKLSALLAEIMPGDIQYSFIVNSGAEAIEGALKLARIHTGRNKIISTNNSFHGKTLGALSATGRALFRDPFKPLLADFIHIDFDDIAAAEKAIDEKTAAIIVEPIQGEGGMIVPTPGYMLGLRRLCDQSGSLLICDEVQTGLGRTGKLFAVDHEGVVPDIMVTAKALGGGVMPIGAFSASKRVWDKYIENPFLHTSTFGGNPLACTAAIATVKILKREYDSFNVADKGTYFLRKLLEIKTQYPKVIKSVRGKGLMIGLELEKEGLGGFFMAEMIKKGILVAYTLNNPKVIRLEPPLIITNEQIDQVIVALREIADAANCIAAEF